METNRADGSDLCLISALYLGRNLIKVSCTGFPKSRDLVQCFD